LELMVQLCVEVEVGKKNPIEVMEEVARSTQNSVMEEGML